MNREALKLALEALENLFGIPDKWTGEGGGDVAVWRLGGSYRAQQAITAIKEALAQPEQHQDWCASLTQMLLSMPPKPAPCNCKPPQRTWVGLTDEELFKLWDEDVSCDMPDTFTQFKHTARAIEAAHGIKGEA